MSSPLTVALVHYKQPTNDRDNNVGYDNGGYADAVASVIPVAPVPMISGSLMYGSVPDRYDNEPNVYTSGPSTTKTQNLESNAHKAKAHLSKPKNKHKNYIVLK